MESHAHVLWWIISPNNENREKVHNKRTRYTAKKKESSQQKQRHRDTSTIADFKHIVFVYLSSNISTLPVNGRFTQVRRSNGG